MGSVKVLLEAGADASACRDDGENLITQAAASGNTELVEHVLGVGLDVNARDDVQDHSFAACRVRRACQRGRAVDSPRRGP